MAAVPLCADCGREITDTRSQPSLCAECEDEIQAADPAWQPNAASKAAIMPLETYND